MARWTYCCKADTAQFQSGLTWPGPIHSVYDPNSSPNKLVHIRFFLSGGPTPVNQKRNRRNPFVPKLPSSRILPSSCHLPRCGACVADLPPQDLWRCARPNSNRFIKHVLRHSSLQKKKKKKRTCFVAPRHDADCSCNSDPGSCVSCVKPAMSAARRK